jgi:hypothetical protein
VTRCYIAYQYDQALSPEFVVVKIGFSKNPTVRFSELQAMSWNGPKWIEATTQNTSVLGSTIERFLHDHLAAYRVHHEWFHVSRNALDAAKNEVWRRFGESFALEDLSDIDEEDAARDVMARRVGA